MVKPGRQSQAPTFESNIQSDTPDLTGLSLSVDQILHNCFLRANVNNPYSTLGDKYVGTAVGSVVEWEALSKTYASEQKYDLPPHVFNLARNAYAHLTRDKADQSILLCGEAGSGKSLSLSQVTRHLCDLSKTGKKKSRIHSAILKVDSVLSAFGNAATELNPSSSFHSRYIEFQFDENARMVGAKFITFLLDRTRVTRSYSEEDGRNFHVFYQLLAGATDEERQQWFLEKPEHFNFLNQSKACSKILQTDSESFDTLRENLKYIGIGRRQQTQVFQLIAAILHLGNINFSNSDVEGEPCTVKNEGQLGITAELLGLDPEVLQSVLVRKCLVRRDLISVFLDAEGATQQRNALAKSLYAIATTWIVDQINNYLCKGEADWTNFISVLDIPGISGRDDYEPNDLTTLMKNYANTRVSSFVDSYFSKESLVAIFESEGLGPLNKSVNTPSLIAVNMMDSGRNDLFSLIDDLTLNCTTTKFPDSPTVLSRIIESCSYSSAYQNIKASDGPPSFGIRHHSGCSIAYSTEELCELNADIVQGDFIGIQ